jgi:uncharacterized linocin/CFP29 family protein
VNGNGGNAGVEWAADVWQAITDTVTQEVAKVRTGQKVFPTTMLDGDPTELQDEAINFKTLSIREGRTKQFVEIYQQFPLTKTQVAKEATDKTCLALSRMAAKALALAEDTIIFQGRNGTLGPVSADQVGAAGNGLLGEATPANANDGNQRRVSRPIDVKRIRPRRPGVIYGEKVFAAVVEGIAKLVSKGQAPNYALFLPTRVYADTFVAPSMGSLVTTADRIRPLVEGGFCGTGTLPADQGLLVALGGEPTRLCMGREANTEFERKLGREYIFRVSERFNFIERDPRSLVALNFL